MKPFVFFAWIVAAVVGVYGSYSWWQAGKVPTTIDITSSASFKTIPATICELGNDSGSITGTLYVFHNAARFDVSSISTGAPIITHFIVTHEDSVFAWLDGKSAGAKFTYGGLFNALGLNLITRVTCKPWWFPAGDLFVVPSEVTIPKS